jgi:hypothetical protein
VPVLMEHADLWIVFFPNTVDCLCLMLFLFLVLNRSNDLLISDLVVCGLSLVFLFEFTISLHSIHWAANLNFRI